MVVEILYDDQEWPIDLPAEPPRDRVLVGRREDGSEAVRWEWDDVGAFWLRKGAPRTHWQDWHGIVSGCMRDNLTLFSLPSDIPGVPGGTTPRED